MHNNVKFSFVFLICCLSHFGVLSANMPAPQTTDTIIVDNKNLVQKSIYPVDGHKRSWIYNLIVGKHYRELYSIPITVKSTELYNLHGGLKYIGQLPRLHAIFFEDKNSHLYLVRPLGGATTFIESDFFRNTYNVKEYKDTYISKFVGDAYTITHPYAFLVASKLAKEIGASSFNAEIYYIPKYATTDTIADGTKIDDRLISIYDLKNFSIHSKVINTNELLNKIQESKSFHVNQTEYIRERILDLLIGDWNKTEENWQWYEIPKADSLIYMPMVADRSHVFTKVDGAFFKIMLNVFGLTSITNYDYKYNNLKKANGIAIPLDIALVSRTSNDIWIEQAKHIKGLLTDSIIEEAFKTLPQEIYETKETEIIKNNLKKRRDAIDDISKKYYEILQETPVITGTNKDDLFVIEQDGRHSNYVRIYDRTSNELLLDKKYTKGTQEIWLYGLEGNDEFRIQDRSKRSIPITLVGGKGANTYHVEGGKNTDIYDYKSHKPINDTLGNAKLIRTDIEKVHTYDYKKLKYQTISFTPWGVYDSDLGFYLGAYLSKTMYGFKRSPYSYRHRIGFSYLEGLMYQGLFPSLDETRGFNIEAIFGVANDFYNFFGYGNQTYGHRDAPIEYNRVDIAKYSIQPSYYWKLTPQNQITAKSTLELYNIDKPTDRFINQIYNENDPIFDKQLFFDINLSYEINRVLKPIASSFNFWVTPGWTWNLKYLNRSFPYIKSKLTFEANLTDRLSLATALFGTVLFSNEYEFYQAASSELRGFRDNRFIGQQSFYQRTDLRFDLGRLKNPFTPIQYGVFAGFDHGRVWLPSEYSDRWHVSYGGGFWLTLFRKYTGKFSYFGSDDGARFYIGIGLGL